MYEKIYNFLCQREKPKSGSGTAKGTLSLFVVSGQGLCYTGIAALLRSPSRGKEVVTNGDFRFIYAVCWSTGSSLLPVQVA